MKGFEWYDDVEKGEKNIALEELVKRINSIPGTRKLLTNKAKASIGDLVDYLERKGLLSNPLDSLGLKSKYLVLIGPRTLAGISKEEIDALVNSDVRPENAKDFGSRLTIIKTTREQAIKVNSARLKHLRSSKEFVNKPQSREGERP